MKEDEIDKIVDFLTEKLYSHQYFIGRKEAREDLGIKTVTDADPELANLMSNLFEEYKKEMELDVLWNPEGELGANAVANNKKYKVAIIESAMISNFYELSVEYKKQTVNMVQQTPQGPVQIPQEQVGFRITGQGWK